MREMIAETHGVSVEVSDHATDDYLRILDSIEFGSGGLRYRRVDAKEHVRRLGTSFFFVARRANSAIAIFALTPQRHVLGAQHIDSFYRSQLCVIPVERRRGVASILRNAAMSWIRENLDFSAFFTWGCIEAGNTGIVRLLEGAGLSRLVTLHSLLCFRQWPKLSSSEINAHQDLETVTIELRHYGMAAKFLYRTLLRHVGPARRRFDPQRFRYIKLSSKDLLRLDRDAIDTIVKHCMALHGTHYAVIVCDQKHPRNSALRRALGPLVQSMELHVMIENFGVPEAQLQCLEKEPLEFSPLDI